MTKRFFLIAAVALLFTACAKDEVDVATPIQKDGTMRLTIGASFENKTTKSDFDDDGNFTWSYEDGIKVYSNTKYWSVLTIMDNESASELGPKYEYANFTTPAFQGDYISTAAVFPQTVIPAYNDPTLSLTLPATIAWNDASLDDLANRTMQADNIMVARGFVDGANTLDFKNVGGLFRLTLNNVPVGATKVDFVTNKKINGTFEVGTVEENGVEFPVINTSDSYEEGENKVTITFPNFEVPTKMVFFIPVPVGTYQIGFAVKDSENNVLWEFYSTSNNSVARAHMVKMPTLSHITVGGGGEGATNIIVTPTAYSGTVNLPSTLNNIYVRMNQTDGTINLEYSSAANAQHPQNVYLQALGDITALNINLPDSHVELTGTDDNNVQVVTNVTASTSINTFVVDNKVQIGKTDNEETVGGLTINGGSLDLSAPVVGPVTVVYDVVSETVNKTSEKVSININSTIKDLVVTSASTQTAPDKIYVTLSSASKVNETLSVPETNCNLYIAPGAQAKTVTTSAAENTIAGAIEHLAAEGDGTSVVVEKKGSITGSISSTDKASIVIVERTQEEVAEKTAGVITANTSTSTQGTIDTVADNAVAMIGSESYSTLAKAFAAVVDGQTIKLISDVTLEETFVVALGEKAVTLDLGGKTLTGRTNLTSGYLTIQNGNVVNTGGQPLNVYGSDTQGAKNYSVLSVARDVTVTGKYGVCVFGKTASTNGYGAVVNVEGKLIANDGIFVSGNLGNNVAADMNNIVNISGTINSESDVAVALNGWATVNVQSGAKITGNTGIAVKRGVLNVYDGATVTANGQWVTPPAANNSGTEPTGAAVSMTNTYNDLGAMAVNIAGGSFTSANGEALYKADQTYSKAATFTVTGGSFSSDPSAFVPAGLVAVKNGNVWTVQNSTYKASIGSTLYETLDAAIAAAENGAKIDILVDQTIDKGWTIEKSLEINLNNKTVTFSGETLANYPSQRVFVVNGEANLNIHDGSILLTEHDGNTSAKNLWGTIRFYSSGTLTMTNVVTDNYCKNGLNVKMLNGTGVFNNVTINSKYGGAVEVGGDKNAHTVATATFTNCNFSNEGDYDWCSTTVGTCYNGVANIESGNYSGYYGVYVFSSGGTINVAKGVTITGSAYSVVSEKDQSNYADFDDAVVNIAGGKITGAYRIGETHAALNISGGTYTVDPTKYVVSGCTATQSGNVWTVGPVSGVAAIGSTGYNTLADAVAAVKDGETITLISDVTLEETFVVALGEKAVTLDLGGKTLTGRTNLTSGNLTLQNGNVVNTGGQPLNVYGSETQGAQNYSVLSVASDVTVTGKYGVCVFGKTATTNGYGAVVNVEGKLIANNGIFVSGNLGNNVAADMNNIVNISGTLTSESDVAVALNGWATVNVQSGAKITGNTGIAVKRGVLNVNDGATVTANGQWVTPPAANNSGTEPTGAAVSMTNTYNNYGAMAVNIAGGSFTSANGEALYKANQTYSNAATFTVTGGSFSSDPSAFVAAGYEAVDNGNGTWTVQELQGVAQIEDSYYATLAEAVTAAQSGDTIVILSDFTLEGNAGVTIPAGKDVTIDLNGRTIKNLVNADANSQLIVNRGTLTITDSSAGANGTMTNEIASGVHTGAWTNYNYYTNIITNFGTLTINAGNLTQVATTNISYVIDNLGANSSVTINGGSLTAGYIPIRAYNATTSVTIHGGSLSGLFDLYLQLTTTLVIDGGTFSAPTRSIIYVDAASNISISGNSVFTNGTDRKFIEFDTDAVKDASTLSVTGGTYNTDPSDYVAPGYEAVQYGNNWNVKVKAQTGYAWDNGVLPSAPSVSGNVINVTNANAQYVLDGAYGSIDGKTINFTENITSTLELGRPTKYAGSNTKYYRSSYNTEERTLEFIVENSGKVVDGNYTNLYKRSVKNVKFTANSGVSIKGIHCNAGSHIYGAGSYDCVREIHTTSEGGSLYFCANDIEGISFEGITFTSPSNLETSVTEASMKNVTFKNCIFNIGSTDSGNYALRYYQESKTTSEVKNLVVDGCVFNTVYQGVYTMHINGVTVKDCTFSTTGHNAIAVQTQDVAFNHGNVVLTGNTGTGIGDRFIRFNNVASGTNITITGNNATCSKDTNDEECIKASSLASSGITYNVSGNTWINYKEAYNEELRDK